MFLIVRCVNEPGILSMKGISITLMDRSPLHGINVYDFPLGYNLNALTGILRSENAGNKTWVLHDNDVDYTDRTNGIAGVVAGIYCAQYTWWLQVGSFDK